MLTVTFDDQLVHVRTLAKQLGIGWAWESYFVAHLSRRSIGTPEVRTWGDLASAAHELGHTQVDALIDHRDDVIAEDWVHGGRYVVNTAGEQLAWRWTGTMEI